MDEFVRRLKLEDQNQEKRFAFFLGAGCSITSGIPAAATLVKDIWLPRLRDIRAPHEPDHEAWAESAIDGYVRTQPAASYGRLIDELFITPDDRQREIESLCDGRSPAFGYAVLAQLVARSGGRFNVVLTTNFDDLVADALYLFTDSRPLVIQHESLAAFIRPTRTRPLVVKLHGDHRLAPRNTALETSALEVEIARHTAMVLNDRGLIFMGYGGNDVGIRNMLRELPIDALPFGAYWVHPEEPSGPIREWLHRRKGIWVKSGWFDEVMLLARSTFDLPHPEAKRFTKIFNEYHAAFQRLSDSIAARETSSPEAAILSKAVQETQRSFPDFWKAIAEAEALEKTDKAAAERVYRQGVVEFPDAAPLLVRCANFLASIGDRSEEAEGFYKRAIEADPSYDYAPVSYATFLTNIPDRRAEAEPFFQRAIHVAPDDGYDLVVYARYLEATPDRRSEAESLYKRAIAADPAYGFALRSYADHLEQDLQRRMEADSLYKRAIEADPKDVFTLHRYARFVQTIPERRAEAEFFYKRAIEIDPDYAFALVNYASFLEETPTRRDEAELLYKRAVEADREPDYPLIRYAMFLDAMPDRRAEAASYYKRALEIDPDNAYARDRLAALHAEAS